MEHLLAALRAVAEADPAAACRAVRARRADRQRAGPDPRPEPAAGIAASEASVRCRAARSLPRGQLGVLSAERRSGRRAARRASSSPPAARRDATIALDLQRLAAIKRQRAELAAAYFRDNAAHWHSIRSLYVDEREVEAALVEIIARRRPARSARYRHRHRAHARDPGAAGRACARHRPVARDAGGGAGQSRAGRARKRHRSGSATCTSCRCPTRRSTRS